MPEAPLNSSQSHLFRARVLEPAPGNAGFEMIPPLLDSGQGLVKIPFLMASTPNVGLLGRMRHNRVNLRIRSQVKETVFRSDDLIQPLFLKACECDRGIIRILIALIGNLIVSAAFASLLVIPVCAAPETPPQTAAAGWLQTLSSYNVAWQTPSGVSVDSMPLSGHNLALNVWADDTSVFLLVGSPNCLDENGMQVKLGLIRIAFDSPVFKKSFRQELRLEQSEIVISGQTATGEPLRITLWCEANATVAHAQLRSAAPVNATVSYETWAGYGPGIVDGGIQWVRRLPEQNPRRLRDMKQQGMTEFAQVIPDPLSKLTLGGRIDASGLVAADTVSAQFNNLPTKVCAMKTAVPVGQLDLTMTFRMEQDASIAAWETALQSSARSAQKNIKASRDAALAWWSEFWNRSYIAIQPKPGIPPVEDKPWLAARNYALVRYMLAANSSGRAMTLFNGGTFTCTGNPDSRHWDKTQFMAQNQRLVYWPMLRSGDFDLLSVALDFYRDRTEMSRRHAKKFWGVEGGVAWPEAFSIFGMGALGMTPDGRCKPSHLNYHYTSGMEFALMMLEFEKYTGNTVKGYAEPALGILKYYDRYYQDALVKKTGKPLDDKGHIVIYPSDACEPYHGCTNNTDVVAGLTALTRELLSLSAGELSPEQRAYVEGFQKRIPEFPIKEKDGRRYYAAADSWERVMFNGNMDFPQMYICFPFSILSLGRSDMSLARNTWELSPIKESIQHQNQCWYQTPINLARMGMTREAASATLEKLLHGGARFPVFYRTFYGDQKGKEFCHLPDMDHGGTAMLGLQEMLMQTDGRRILIGPAWPADWNVHFKLRAPYQTTVEGRVESGKVIIGKVTPESRRKDIEVFPLRQ